MPREPRNIGASVRARLLDRARAEKSDFQILLTRYALERLLYRLSVSEHRERFILKGAMLFVTWVADPFRPTRDLDLLGHGDNDVGAIADTFRSICAEPVADDGVVFDHAGLQAAPIREEVEYGGVRVRTTATIAGARVPIQVDIGFGDAVTPAPVEIDYPDVAGQPRAAPSGLSRGDRGRGKIRSPDHARYREQSAQGFLRSLADCADIRISPARLDRSRAAHV